MFEFSLLAAANEAAGGAAHFNWAYVGKHAFNLAVLIGALTYILKKPLSEFMKSRRREMSEKFEESGRKLAEAKKLFEECDAKIANLESEISSLKSSIAAQSQTERQNILLRAGEEKETILKEVNESLEFAAARAGAAIREEAAAAVMRVAENLLRESADEGQTASVKTFEAAVKDGKMEGKWLPRN
ncbi:ATP synthase F0 subunit B [Candidatus Mycalebacterium sp.]